MPDTQDVFKQGLEQITGPTRSWLTPPEASTVAGANAKLVREMAKDLQKRKARKERPSRPGQAGAPAPRRVTEP